VRTSLEAGKLAGHDHLRRTHEVKRCDGSLTCHRRVCCFKPPAGRCVPARTAHSQTALTFVMRPTTAHRLTPAHPAWRPRAVNALWASSWWRQRALTRGRIKTNPRGWSPLSFGCRECAKRAPATASPGSSERLGKAGERGRNPAPERQEGGAPRTEMRGHRSRHSEISANLLYPLRSNRRDFSECALMDNASQVDFDSAIPKSPQLRP
jgi:hypothetical protein